MTSSASGGGCRRSEPHRGEAPEDRRLAAPVGLLFRSPHLALRDAPRKARVVTLEDRTPSPTSALAPGFLVASPTLADPNFAGSLVLMAEHHDEGALGFVVNRPGPIRVADVLGGLDEALRAAAEARGRADAPVLVGGPVQPERLWILFRPGPSAPEEGAV